MMRITTGATKPKVRIIRMRKVPFIDSTGLHNLETLINSSKSEGIDVVLSGVKDNVRTALDNAGITALVGQNHVCSHISQAVQMANQLVPQPTRQYEGEGGAWFR